MKELQLLGQVSEHLHGVAFLALQAMVVHDVTKVHANDLITCDSRGLLTVFCNGNLQRLFTLWNKLKFPYWLLIETHFNNFNYFAGQILSRLSLSNESLDCLRVSQVCQLSCRTAVVGQLLSGVRVHVLI